MPFQKGNRPANAFKKGQSGNPGGRPITKPVSDAIRALLDGPGSDLDRYDYRVLNRKQMRAREAAAKKLTGAHLVARSLVSGAIYGDKDGQVVVSAHREIMDRIEGKVVQPISGPDGGGIPVYIIEPSGAVRMEMKEKP